MTRETVLGSRLVSWLGRCARPMRKHVETLPLNGTGYTHMRRRRRRDRLSCSCMTPYAKPHGAIFNTLNTALKKLGPTMGFAMNAGMISPMTRAPVGYTLRTQKTPKFIRATRSGNLVLPNGVCVCAMVGPMYRDQKAFVAKGPPIAASATQFQGRCWVNFDGKLHPCFLQSEEAARYIREWGGNQRRWQRDGLCHF